MKREEFKTAAKQAFPLTVPVLVGFLVLGMAYGVLMGTKGYAPIFAILMSMIAFCGSMQYVALTLLVSAFNPFYALFLSILVNARHLFYGISMLDKYKNTGRAKPLLVFTLCDETFSILCDAKVKPGVNETYFYLCVSLFDYTYWQIGTILGAFLGQFITFDTKGLDFALTALFVVIFVEQWKSQKNHSPALIGIACSVLCLLIFGESYFIVAAMVLMIVIFVALRNKPEFQEKAANDKNETVEEVQQ